MCYKTVRGIVPPCVQALITACVGNSEDAHCRHSPTDTSLRKREP